MVRLSFLKKVYFKNQAEKLLKVFKKHKNVCSWLYKKKEFFFSIAEEIPLDLFFQTKETIAQIYNLLKVINYYKMIIITILLTN